MTLQPDTNPELREQIADICRKGYHGIAETRVVNELLHLFSQYEQEVREEIIEKTFKRKKSDMRKEVAVILAREGYTYRQIAKLIGVSSTRSISVYLNGYPNLFPTQEKRQANE